MPLEVTMPRLSDSMEEGTVVAWLVAEGETVRRGQPLVDIETDKATMTYEAEADGTLGRILVAEGDTAALGAAIALIVGPGEPEPEPAATPAVMAIAKPSAQVTADEGDRRSAAAAEVTSTRAKASPLARRAASDLGVDLAALSGSGPGARIVLADVNAASSAAATVGPRPSMTADGATETAKGKVTLVELSRLQATVARRMAESRATAPSFELAVDVDMSACVALREQLRAAADPLPSYNDLVVMACGRALREHPRANGSYRDGRFELYERINVGIAVAADDALVVPTITEADRRSLGSIAVEARRLAAAVRDGTITAPDLGGGTFTVSNLGMFGIDRFGAVINPPQAAILAVGALTRRPFVTEEAAIEARPQMTLTLACDHRILYGADAAAFLRRIVSLLEEPLALLIDHPASDSPSKENADV